MMDSSFLSESPLTSYLRIIDRLQARIDDISTKLQKYGYASVMSKLMDDNYDLKLKQKYVRQKRKKNSSIMKKNQMHLNPCIVIFFLATEIFV